MSKSGNGAHSSAQAKEDDAVRTEVMEIARLMDADPADAEGRLRALLQRKPGEINAAYLLGVSLRLQDRSGEAIAVFQDVVRSAPGFGVAHQELGLTLFSEGHLAKAKSALKEAVRIEPRLPLAWKNLGDVLTELGDNPGAREAHQKFHALSSEQNASTVAGMAPALQEAREAIARGELQRADVICRRQLQANPSDVWAIRLLAEVGVNVGAVGDAKGMLERCLEIEPKFHEARTYYADVLCLHNDYAEALEQLDILAEQQPGNPNNGFIKAKVMTELGNYEMALDIYSDLTKFYDKQAPVLVEYGHTLRTVGRHDDAVAAYREGLQLEPNSGSLWFSLANLKTFRFNDGEVDTLRSLLKGTQLRPQDESSIAFALGKAEEDNGNADAAFDAFDRGNKARRQITNYDADENTKLTADMKQTFSPDFFAAHQGSGSKEPDPIFILGLPRSGSTLVEQILASHPRVDGTMELPDINVLTRRIGGSTGPYVASTYPGVTSTLSDDMFETLGEDYLQRAEPRRQGAPMFIDKMPGNFQHIGFIKAILPNAKIIDVRRSPMSTCYSVWKQAFAVGKEFAYDLEDIGRYFCDYIDLMDHWDDVLPGFVHRVDYENLVGDLEIEVRALLEFCGLDFDPACLSFHENKRTVRTASSEQVRQPIYKDALEQWRRYDAHLGTLRAALAPIGDRFDLT